jgi:cytochrome c oxidase assembly protein subunit 15
MDWLLEFEKYQQFPEYQLVNYGMTMDEFKFIFFMEYAHRLLGRLIGLFFFIPLIVFWIRGRFDSATKKRMILVMFLGMAQGAMGWYMVKSGLVKDPSVSAYRLTAHLLLALVLLGLLFWTALSQMNPQMLRVRNTSRVAVAKLVHFSALAIALTITYGGFVAGLKAGKIYNTYPLMGGQFLPSEWNFMSPLAKNFVENPAMVQWIHRTLAIITMVLVVTTMMRLIQGEFGLRVKKTAMIMIALIMTQVTLGIMTLLHEVPVSLGTLHQGMGVIVLMMILQVMFLMGRDESVSLNQV